MGTFAIGQRMRRAKILAKQLGQIERVMGRKAVVEQTSQLMQYLYVRQVDVCVEVQQGHRGMMMHFGNIEKEIVKGSSVDTT